MLSIFKCFVTPIPSLSPADVEQSQVQKYKNRTEKIRLEDQPMRVVEDAVERILRTYPEVPTDDQYVTILKQIHSEVYDSISSTLSSHGFKTVSAYSLYPKSNARYKVKILRDFFKTPAPVVDVNAPKNYNGNIEYCKKANATQLSSTTKDQLFSKLHNLVKQAQRKYYINDCSEGLLRQDLPDSDCREILNNFYAELTPYQRAALKTAGIKTISKYSWYPDSRAKFKVFALLDCWCRSGNMIGSKRCSTAYTESKVITTQQQTKWFCAGNSLIYFMVYYFFSDVEQSELLNGIRMGWRGKVQGKSPFFDVNVPRLVEGLYLITNASSATKTTKVTLTNGEILEISNDETRSPFTLTFCNTSDLDQYSIQFYYLTPQEIIHGLSRLSNVQRRERGLTILAHKLSKAHNMDAGLRGPAEKNL